MLQNVLNKTMRIKDIPVVSILTKCSLQNLSSSILYLSPNKYKEEFIFEVFNRKNEEFPMGC